jgi:hypothetical protein
LAIQVSLLKCQLIHLHLKLLSVLDVMILQRRLLLLWQEFHQQIYY